MDLIAYRVGTLPGWTLRPASKKRQWMNETHGSFAYRCLPLTIANSAGWVIECPAAFSAVWDGEQIGDAGVTLTFADTADASVYGTSIHSHFGSGVITFNIPYLFRTSSGVALHARGVPNAPKYNVAPLEGLIETDWLPFTFTMNWKIQRPHIPVHFAKGEPICFIQPFSIPLLESAEPEIRSIDTDPELKQQFAEWRQSRRDFIARDDRTMREWQKTYTRGQRMDGTKAHAHRTTIRLPHFADHTTEPEAP
ncbi:MAG: DUF6065 family protein [Bacteroidota bacterium]